MNNEKLLPLWRSHSLPTGTQVVDSDRGLMTKQTFARTCTDEEWSDENGGTILVCDRKNYTFRRFSNLSVPLRQEDSTNE